MILKRIFEEYDLPIERILIREYKRLNLTLKESYVLMALFSISKKRRTFSMIAISKRVEYPNEVIGQCIESLQDKGFLDIALEIKDEKEREVFDIDKTLKQIEQLYINDEKERIRQLESAQISKTIDLFEKGLGRPLMAFELETVRAWYEESQYSHANIVKAITATENQVSIKFVERYLNQGNHKPIEVDQDIENALDAIYKKIR